MKLLRRLQKNLASLGHSPNQSVFNKIQFWAFFKISLDLILLYAYIVREQHSSKEYIASIFIMSGVFAISIARVSILFENEIIFELIDGLKTAVNESELNVYVYVNVYVDSNVVKIHTL